MLGNNNRGGTSGGRKVCPFFLQGRCKFGDNCHNEHPRSSVTTSNRFSGLNNSSANAPARSGRTSSNNTSEFGITVENIRRDLTRGDEDGERPNWPLSAYAPGNGAPRQLLEGPVELSPEELRVQCYLLRSQGAEQEYIQTENALIAQIDQQIDTILRDLEGAKKFCTDLNYTSRSDAVVKPTAPFRWESKPGLARVTQQSSPFGQPAPSAFGTPSKSAFGQPSSLGNASTAAFGRQSTLSFGQPSALNASKPAFGTPSTPSTFGQPSNLGNSTAGSAFGQPSAFGKPSPFGASSNAPAFGQTSAFGQASTLRQPSPLAQMSTPGQASAFGQASDSRQPSPFGQTSTAAQTSAFGQAAALEQSKAPFGAPSAPRGFGQPSAFGAPTAPNQGMLQPATSTFGQPSTPQSSVLGSSQPESSAFGRPSAFGAAASNPSPFASAVPPAMTSTSAFGKPSPFASATNNTLGGSSAFGQPSAFAPKSVSSQPVSSPFNSQPSSNTTFAAKQVQVDPVTQHHYRILPDSTSDNPRGTRKERIWFPQGAPPSQNTPSGQEDYEAPSSVYDGGTAELARMLESIYRAAAKEGRFVEADGVMPEVPPKREWVSFEM